eukprot:TRINITY_DN88137_c0_g1_i1.p1 TRINITY_DN88137_c0_g1~~TRINITY_DN88137_c0_g1_i1.p1  ORF type:complete len:693 (+),score=128.97 TRINITY_DN88137_c0_g1_i1:65-2143(+)
MLGSATEEAVARRLLKPGASDAAKAAADEAAELRVKRLSSKRRIARTDSVQTRASSRASSKAPMSLVSLEPEFSRQVSGSESRLSSRSPSKAQLALPSPESPSQCHIMAQSSTARSHQSLALTIPSAQGSTSRSHHSLALAIPSSRSPSLATLQMINSKESLLEGVLAVPFQTPPPQQVTRYQNQLMATRPWLQAAIERKVAGSEKGLYRTQSLPAFQAAATSSDASNAQPASKAPSRPRKKTKEKNEPQKSGCAKRLETVTFGDDEEEETGLAGMWLDYAEGEEPQEEVRVPKQPHDILVPDCVKALDYWQAQEVFCAHDLKKRGYLDRDEFATLLQNLCRGKEHMTTKRAHAIYDDIDIDESGTMERDEFLGWVFQTHNNYLSSVRKKLETMDPMQVHELFKKIDVNYNGLIDKDEFWVFVDKFSPGEMTRQASDELHMFIDKDLSGEIDLDEFLNWVHPGRELRILMGERDVDRHIYDEVHNIGKKRSMLPRGFSALGSQADDEDNFKNPKKPVMESQPGKPTVLEFTVGREFLGSVNAVKKALRNVFGPNQLRFEIAYDPTSMDSCTKVEAKVGRGIILWERDRMLPFKDDPFATVKTAENWIKDVLSECLPDVVAAANLRFQKRIRKNMCWVCKKSLTGLNVLYVEDTPLCSKDCRLALRKQLLGVYEVEARVRRLKRGAQTVVKPG